MSVAGTLACLSPRPSPPPSQVADFLLWEDDEGGDFDVFFAPVGQPAYAHRVSQAATKTSRFESGKNDGWKRRDGLA